ncbi:MAG: preprotein translocase subunit SecB [Rhodobacteraceae bacterium HLUCCA08]|nr:MAG: preprotein translocase subunit SecB [Rhodobacteraceae bacterium HLUCCA08]
MAENDTQTNGAQAAADAAALAQQIKQRILAQFVKDLSFENIMAQTGIEGEVKPEIKVEVALDARKRSAEHQYEVITKLKITSNNQGSDKTLFVMELDYSGIFHIEGVKEEHMHPYLHVECARMTFPFVRRIVSDVTRDGGFPPLNLETIDFLQLYRQQIAQRAAAQQAAAKPADA